MSAIFILKKKTSKNTNFLFLKDPYLKMGSPIEMDVGVFLQASVDFLECVVS